MSRTTPDTVIRIAENEVGYLEKSLTAYQNNKDIIYRKQEGAGKDNVTMYGLEMHEIYPKVMDFPAAWCDAFVDWCFQKAYGVATAKSLLAGNFDDYTVASANMYKQKNAWYKTPLPGDQVFFTNGTRICHTGLVYKVDKRYVYTIEGNTSTQGLLVANGGSVAKKKYVKTFNRIAGYGRPRYDLPATVVMGDVNNNVAFLQERLISKGYALPKYGADGDFGSETFLAVKQFRVDHGIGSSGICDSVCWEKLLYGA